MSTEAVLIDSRAPRFNQVFVATGTLVGLLSGAWWVWALLAIQLALTSRFGKRVCLACIVYFRFVQPWLGEGPLEDGRATRFANRIGAIVLTAAVGSELLGFGVASKALAISIVALAGIASTTGFCLGCAMYRWRWVWARN